MYKGFNLALELAENIYRVAAREASRAKLVGRQCRKLDQAGYGKIADRIDPQEPSNGFHRFSGRQQFLLSWHIDPIETWAYDRR